MNIDKLTAVVEKQEELLCFPRFGRKDAWGLGNEAVKIILEHNHPMSVNIRLPSGLTVFQYLAEGSTADNQRWMDRKFNTVRDFEKSTLLFTLGLLKRRQKSLKERGLDPEYYAWGGGGFPIRIKDSGLAAVFTVSGLPGLEDHAVLVNAAAAFLKAAGVPPFPVNIKI
ncbi:MAG: heme-binding protein [Treponema sp.]|jgi:uncharacterized protein (UPF0303 family)|nr:heme-binding protein [Treponema sp.]